MTNTIPNVPCVLLERVLNAGWGSETVNALDDLRDFLASAPSPADHVEDVRAMVAAPSPAGVDGWDVAGDILEKLSAAQAIIGGLRGEVADLHTTMMAAAVEIQEHWAAHCDEEGYGPANLMHRLERGIASQYGYSAETLVRLESQRDQQSQRIGELERLLRSCLPALSDGGCAALANRIDAALSAGKEGE